MQLAVGPFWKQRVPSDAERRLLAPHTRLPTSHLPSRPGAASPPGRRVAALVSAAVAGANFVGGGLLHWRGVVKVRPSPSLCWVPWRPAAQKPPAPAALEKTGRPSPDHPPPPRPQVWPKVFDLVNVALYVSMAVVAHTHPAFAKFWMGLFVSGITAAYFWASLLARRPFSLEMAKETADPGMWQVKGQNGGDRWVSKPIAWLPPLLPCSFLLAGRPEKREARLPARWHRRPLHRNAPPETNVPGARLPAAQLPDQPGVGGLAAGGRPRKPGAGGSGGRLGCNSNPIREGTGGSMLA